MSRATWIAAALLVAAPLRAQEGSSSAPALNPIPVPIPTAENTAGLLMVGLLTGVASAFGGGFVGQAIETHLFPCESFCEFAGFTGVVLGFGMTPSAVIPIVVHATNRDHHAPLPLTMIASMLAAGVTLGVGITTESLGLMMLGPPVAALVTTLGVESLPPRGH